MYLINYTLINLKFKKVWITFLKACGLLGRTRTPAGSRRHHLGEITSMSQQECIWRQASLHPGFGSASFIYLTLDIKYSFWVSISLSCLWRAWLMEIIPQLWFTLPFYHTMFMTSIVILTLRFYILQDRHSDLMLAYLLMFLSGLEMEI